MSNNQILISHIRSLIANDQFQMAIQQLSALLKDSPRLDEAVQQSARYNNVVQQIRLGLVDFEAANIAKNQIRYGILDLLSEIEEKQEIQTIKAGIEQYALKIEKNVVKNSPITAGGNVTIGDTIHTESQTSRILRFFLYAFLPILTIGFAYFYYRNEKLKTPLNLTVLVTNKTPNPNLPFNKIKISLIYGDKSETQNVEKEAIFKDISPIFKGEKISLLIESDGFSTVDTAFILSANMVVIPLSRNNSLGRIYGSIKDENGNPLADVKVSVLDMTVTTTLFGNFTLSIPFEKQRKTQRIKAFKQNFKIWDFETPVIENEEIPIILKK